MSCNFQTSRCNLKIRGLGTKLSVRLFYYFYFERNHEVLKSKSPCFLFNKNRKFNKNETEPKMWNTHIVLEGWTMIFSSYKNCKLQLKLWWVGARERKKSAFFVTFILSKGNFFSYLPQCIVYWINFQKYLYFYISKNITLYTFVACF